MMMFSICKNFKRIQSMLLDCITEIFEKDRNAAIKAIRKAQIGG